MGLKTVVICQRVQVPHQAACKTFDKHSAAFLAFSIWQPIILTTKFQCI